MSVFETGGSDHAESKLSYAKEGDVATGQISFREAESFGGSWTASEEDGGGRHGAIEPNWCEANTSGALIAEEDSVSDVSRALDD